MSTLALRPYFDARMRTVNPDFKEWLDSFDPAEIPSTIIDCVWHLKIDTGIFQSLNQNCIEYDIPLVVTVFTKGRRDSIAGVDLALKLVEDILREVARPTNRLTQPTIKNVLPGTFNLDPIDESNDNLIKVSINFTAKILLDFN